MVSIDRLDIEEAEGPWENVVALAHRHDVFQSYAWGRFESEVNGNKPIFLIVRDSDEIIGGQMIVRRPVLGVLRGCEAIGGPLYSEGHQDTVCNAVVDYLEKRTDGSLYRAIRPRAEHTFDALLRGRGFQPSELHTIVVELSRAEDELWRSLHGAARTGVRKAEKAGVVVAEAAAWNQWEVFGEIHARHAREKKSIGVPLPALRCFYERLAPTDHCKLFLGVLGEQCVSGMLFVICREAMLFYAGASDSRCLDASPNDPVMWEAMRWGRRNGIRQLDLYDTDPRSDSPLYGIHRFKAKWGGKLVDRPFYIKGRFYLWARERLRNNGVIRRVANTMRERQWA